MTHKKMVLFLFLLVFTLPTFLYGQESLTITTYYPSPFGSYRELQSIGGTSWTTANWRTALTVGRASGSAIRFVNSGAGARDFGIGASTASNFYAWSTAAGGGTGSAAVYWMMVNDVAGVDTITFYGTVRLNSPAVATVDPLNGAGGYVWSPRYRQNDDT
ncbi:MAG TPA: hypothetical protein PKL77_09385 [Candidatus Omnitrophota bacterium]|nr:hypothetical protein [Candidatus Omnitrophota bacterium]